MTKNGWKTVRVAGRATVIAFVGQTAKASATQDVIVSGTVTFSTTDDSLSLEYNKESEDD